MRLSLISEGALYHNKQIKEVINKFLETSVFQKLGVKPTYHYPVGPVEFETPDGDFPQGDQQVLLFYYDGLQQDVAQKAIKAIQYYLGELGIPVRGNIQPYDDGIIAIPITWKQDIQPYTGSKSQYGVNHEMDRRLSSGQALNVRDVGIEVEPGVWKLTHFIDDVEYCDPETGSWIFSIGRDRYTDEIFASIDDRFQVSNDEYENIFIR